MGFIGTLEDGNWTGLDVNRNNRRTLTIEPHIIHQYIGRTWGINWKAVSSVTSFRGIEALNISASGDINQINRPMFDNASDLQFWRDKGFLFHVDATSDVFRVDKYDLSDMSLTADVYTRDFGISTFTESFPHVVAKLAPWSNKIHVIASVLTNASSGVASAIFVGEWDPDAETMVVMWSLANSPPSSFIRLGIGADSTNVYFSYRQVAGGSTLFTRSHVLEAGGIAQSRVEDWSDSSEGSDNMPLSRWVGNYGLWTDSPGTDINVFNWDKSNTWDLDLESGSELRNLLVIDGEEFTGVPVNCLAYYDNGSVHHVVLKTGSAVTSTDLGNLITYSGTTGLGINQNTSYSLDGRPTILTIGTRTLHKWIDLHSRSIG